MPTPTDLAADLDRLARDTPREDLAALAGVLERAKVAVWARLMTVQGDAAGSGQADGTIGGYGGDAWGSIEERLAIKRELLLHEGVTVAEHDG